MRRLNAPPITLQSFQPFGWLIDADSLPLQASSRTVNSGTSRRFDDVSDLSLDQDGGRPCLAIYRAQALDPAGLCHTLERHRLGTQTFIPLRDAPFIVLVALGDRFPDEATLQAFRVAGHQGITLRAGVWHHPLMALVEADFIVIERKGATIDCELAQLVEPVSLVVHLPAVRSGA